MGELKVLEIGPGPKPQAHLLPEYQEAEIIYLDADPDVHPHILFDAESGPLPVDDETFDGVFASHILEHITYWQELDTIKDWARVLKPGGVLHIAVPSWEWVARQVLSSKPSHALKPYAFAGQVNHWDIHKNMFTLRQLRSLLEKAGLSVTRARTGPLHVMAGSEELVVEQHYMAGVKAFPPPLKESTT